MGTKNVNNYKQKTFRDIFEQLHTQKYKAAKNQIVSLQLNIDPRTFFRHKRKTKKRFLIFQNYSGCDFGLN